jgi:hypothetical protein
MTNLISSRASVKDNATSVILPAASFWSYCACGGAGTSSDRPEFADLIIEAYRAMLALDDFTRPDGFKGVAAAVNNGHHVYSRLLACQKPQG